MRKKKLIWCVLTVLCCVLIAGAWCLKTAAASNTASVGRISASGSRVVFRSEDINYLNRELGRLQSEMDDSVFDSAVAAPPVSDSADMRRRMLSSHGIINYDHGKVTANAANLFALADGTDALGNAYATAICRALNEIGTYFDSDGNVNHVAQTTEAIALGCEQLAEGILQSQSVEHLSVAPVTSANITAGAAAWVNGQCIIGNGADNEEAYQRGIDNGAEGNIQDVDIQYTYHVHTGNSGKDPIPDGDVYYSVDNPEGCYAAAGHTHNAGGLSCPGYWCTKCHYSGKPQGNVSGLSCPYHGTSHLKVSHLTEDGKEYTNYWCTGTREDHYHSECSSTQVNTWIINCGKFAGRTVEEATVIIH